MNVVEIFLLGVGLSMDALAVAVCKGLAMRKVNKKQCLAIAFAFGGFQCLMPIIGWALGSTFAKYIKSVDHWIAFFLLLYIGGKMIIETVHGKGGGYRLCREPDQYTAWEILLLAEGDLAPVSCLQKDARPCPRAPECKTLPLWKNYY